jgi:hypothetical protein
MLSGLVAFSASIVSKSVVHARLRDVNRQRLISTRGTQRRISHTESTVLISQTEGHNGGV